MRPMPPPSRTNWEPIDTLAEADTEVVAGLRPLSRCEEIEALESEVALPREQAAERWSRSLRIPTAVDSSPR